MIERGVDSPGTARRDDRVGLGWLEACGNAAAWLPAGHSTLTRSILHREGGGRPSAIREEPQSTSCATIRWARTLRSIAAHAHPSIGEC